MRIVITVDQAALGAIDQIAAGLAQAGMTVDQILSTTGIITGSADAGSLAALRDLAGVASVESDAEFPILPDEPQ